MIEGFNPNQRNESNPKTPVSGPPRAITIKQDLLHYNPGTLVHHAWSNVKRRLDACHGRTEKENKSHSEEQHHARVFVKRRNNAAHERLGTSDRHSPWFVGSLVPVSELQTFNW